MSSSESRKERAGEGRLPGTELIRLAGDPLKGLRSGGRGGESGTEDGGEDQQREERWVWG